MNDVAARRDARPFKWVGTRPVRPDGVPKVTGTRAVRRRPRDAGHAGRPHPALAARPRAHPLDRHLEGGGAARRQGGDDLRGLPRAEVRVCRPGARRAELLAHDAQHHGAREGALRGPCGRRRGGRQQGHRRRGAVADRGRLRGAAARHRRRRGDEAGRAAAVRGHDHPRRRAADDALEHLEAQRVQARRPRGRLRGGRRGRRDVVQDRAGASGLYRAAGLRRALRRRRPGRALELEPGAFRRAQLHRAAARHEGRRPARLSGRDRRRLRRQDRGLCRAGRRRAGAQVRPSGEGRDEPRGRVQGHRPDLGLVDDGEDRRQARRHDHRRRRALQAAGRRIPGLAVHEHLHVRVRALRHRERARGRLRRGVQPPEGRGLSRAGLADRRLRGRERARRPGAEDRHGPARAAAEERRQDGNADALRREARARRLCRDHRGADRPSRLQGAARQEPGARRRLGLLVQRRRRVERDRARQRRRHRRGGDRQPRHRRLARLDGDHGGRDAGRRLRPGARRSSPTPPRSATRT